MGKGSSKDECCDLTMKSLRTIKLCAILFEKKSCEWLDRLDMLSKYQKKNKI